MILKQFKYPGRGSILKKDPPIPLIKNQEVKNGNNNNKNRWK